MEEKQKLLHRLAVCLVEGKPVPALLFWKLFSEDPEEEPAFALAVGENQTLLCMDIPICRIKNIQTPLRIRLQAMTDETGTPMRKLFLAHPLAYNLSGALTLAKNTDTLLWQAVTCLEAAGRGKEGIEVVLPESICRKLSDEAKARALESAEKLHTCMADISSGNMAEMKTAEAMALRTAWHLRAMSELASLKGCTEDA